MNRDQLIAEIKRKESFLCVGLDVDLEKIPTHLRTEEDPIFAFNKAIIDATHHVAVAYKPNIAFYETYGVSGWNALQKTIEYLNQKYPEVFTIADAKRGDIGNTADRYARAFFEDLNFDSITVAPYMGRDSVEPFLAYNNKHTILLALTSNVGAEDFQTQKVGDHSLFEEVVITSQSYKNSEQLMYVVGATQAYRLQKVRDLAPNHFLLVPGVGAQGGSLKEVCLHGLTKDVGLLVNSSRGIIYASHQKDFAEAAAREATALQRAMKAELDAL
ncbi:orotidine-5'-phosphate decarboxylase [Altibacter sp. HG106]|uniref:orotidine-5'-phosphate decarboxylase n=1 Tax=Altibacter sp. HG106 TaxID=3023937 RepID=UPI0023504319|nr:orotidine-5'-phosphate decarboxylase [Altibacter sp. HG106]MDC7995795.1 orotidine-5'-phosphate decarboxylase [Altibacter sp. HG106]